MRESTGTQLSTGISSTGRAQYLLHWSMLGSFPLPLKVILINLKVAERSETKKLRDRELNPGLPRDRRGYLPLYYHGFAH